MTALYSRAIIYLYGNHKLRDAVAVVYGSIFGLIYQKMKTIDIRAVNSVNVGELANNMTNDVFRIFICLGCSRQVFNSPIILITYSSILVYVFGPIVLVGVGIIIITLMIIILISKIISNITLNKLKINDVRNNDLKMMLSGIKAVKLNGWDEVLAEKIISLRKREKRLIRKLHFLKSFSGILMFLIPSMSGFVSIVLYNQYVKEIGMADAFFVLTVFNLLMGPLNLFYMSLVSVFECIKSFERIRFLLDLPDEVREEEEQGDMEGKCYYTVNSVVLVRF